MTQPDETVTEWLSDIPAEEANYYHAIETYFGRKGGYPWIIRGKDWLLVRQWYEDGIPLDVIAQAIDEYFDRYGQESVPRFLGYVENFVKKHWRLYRMHTLGRLTTNLWPRLTVERLLQWWEHWERQMARAAERARERSWTRVAAVLEKRRASLQRMRRRDIASAETVTPELLETLETRLENFQKKLRRELRKALPEQVLTELHTQVQEEFARRLRSYLGTRTHTRWVREWVDRRIWRILRLPDFSLLQRITAQVHGEAAEERA